MSNIEIETKSQFEIELEKKCNEKRRKVLIARKAQERKIILQKKQKRIEKILREKKQRFFNRTPPMDLKDVELKDRQIKRLKKENTILCKRKIEGNELVLELLRDIQDLREQVKIKDKDRNELGKSNSNSSNSSNNNQIDSDSSSESESESDLDSNSENKNANQNPFDCVYCKKEALPILSMIVGGKLYHRNCWTKFKKHSDSVRSHTNTQEKKEKKEKKNEKVFEIKLLKQFSLQRWVEIANLVPEISNTIYFKLSSVGVLISKCTCCGKLDNQEKMTIGKKTRALAKKLSVYIPNRKKNIGTPIRTFLFCSEDCDLEHAKNGVRRFNNLMIKINRKERISL